MADTLKFGPEWLRQLSGGNSLASPPPTPGLGGKFKLAEYRYGREEMLALFNDSCKAPDDLIQYPPVYVEDVQKPLALISLSEEEQRLMSQSVNSTTVLRSMGRGGQSIRGGGRGISDRGRGRGRGRGDGFPPRGQPFEQAENGGFGRSRGQNKDGFEEVGRKYDRSFSNRNIEEGHGRHPQFSRSLSSDNWREKDKDEQAVDDEGGDWRRAGPHKDRWGSRTSWREPVNRSGFDGERKQNGPVKDRSRTETEDKHAVYRRSRSSESWDTDDLPEWSVPGDDDIDEVGTFDASGQFVSSHLRNLDNGHSSSSEAQEKQRSKSSSPQQRESEKNTNYADPKKEKKEVHSNVPPVRQESAKICEKGESPQTEVQNQDEHSDNASKPVSCNNVSQNSNESNSLHVEHSNDGPSQDVNSVNVPNGKLLNKVPAAETDTLDRLKETAESMVAEMTAEDGLEDAGNRDGQTVKTAVAVDAGVTGQFIPRPEHTRYDERKSTPGSSTPVSGDPQSVGLPLGHEDAFKWFYRDPQGDMQGPFTPEEMAQWFSAGYFTMTLLVKRGCDERFQQLGELIKRWGRVPFLAGPNPPPLLNNAVPSNSGEAPVKQSAPPASQQPTPQAPQDLLNMIPQQILLQQLMQQQMLMRNMQVQIMAQMQEQESFKAMSAHQQNQLVMQMLMQTQPLFMQQMQQLQQLQQQQQHRLSPQPQNDGSAPPPASVPGFHRLQPAQTEEDLHQQAAQGNWPQPNSVWDLDTPGGDVSPNMLQQQQVEQLQTQKAEELRRKQEEEERRQQAEMQQRQEELHRQQEELAREREKMLREKEELERQKQLELKRLEEMRIREEEERRRRTEEERQLEEERLIEEQRRRDEEQRVREMELAAQREEEAHRKAENEQRRRAIEEERRRQEEIHRTQIEEEKRRQEILRLQEIERQEELQRQEREEEGERQREQVRQQELQHQEQQRQQQEALRRLQQHQRDQMARMQLPSTAQWATQSPQRDSSEGKSLAEIQQEEERQSQERERQLEIQRQQMLALQQQQQHQQQQMQKSWTKQLVVNQEATNRLKSLLDIQEEQAKDEKTKKKSKPAAQTVQPKNVGTTLSTPSMWSNVAGNVANNGSQSSGWGGNAVWGSEKSGSGGIGFWDEAVISSKKAATKDSGEFPALGGKKRGQQNNISASAAVAANRNKQMKPKKEEDVVQKLFQSSRPVDDFTQWCERTLTGLATSVDVPTFIAFLQDVESPYEVHDYVRSYLGESSAAKEFGRQFLEKRSQYKQKVRLERQQEEDSIWGPAPAVNPKETRPGNSNDFESVSSRNKNKNKKKKMQKLDKSILGFTVNADPNRVNAGEIENVD